MDPNDFNVGQHTATFKVTDGLLESAEATITVDVLPELQVSVDDNATQYGSFTYKQSEGFDYDAFLATGTDHQPKESNHPSPGILKIGSQSIPPRCYH